MKKAIYIEETSPSTIKRVLAIAPESAAPELDGRPYFIIEDYEPPTLKDSMTKAYPIWDSEAKKFGYIYEDWQRTINQERLDIENLKAELSIAITQAKKANEEIEAQKQRSEQAVLELTQLITSIIGGGADASALMPPSV